MTDHANKALKVHKKLIEVTGLVKNPVDQMNRRSGDFGRVDLEFRSDPIKDIKLLGSQLHTKYSFHYWFLWFLQPELTVSYN